MRDKNQGREARKKRRKQAGLCNYDGCSKLVSSTAKGCPEHNNYYTRRNQARHAAGLCISCDNPSQSAKRHCSSCALKRSVYGKKQAQKPKNRYSLAKRQALKRKKNWEISFEDFKKISSLPCHYCGIEYESATGAGLDRLDNSEGYTVSNVVPCCLICNTVRNQIFTVSEMLVLGAVVRELMLRRPEDPQAEERVVVEKTPTEVCSNGRRPKIKRIIRLAESAEEATMPRGPQEDLG